jgi:peptide/nickel transport system substrate-binding protein
LGTNVDGQVSLTVKTLPADTDAAMTRIARRLVKNLQAVGINAQIELQPPREHRKDVLMRGEYDIYVGQAQGGTDPDFLRPLLHSSFVDEQGKQNPFSVIDITIDKLLSAQRQASGTQRQRFVADLQREIANKQPFGVLSFPSEIWAARTDRFRGWSRFPPTDPLSYVHLATAASGDDREPVIRLTTTDIASTRNLNPVAIQHRTRGIFTGLLYDPLARDIDGTVTPWLAEEWSWQREGESSVCTVRLRPDLTWHDGKAITASDVAFTYRFLNDTLMGSGDTPVPSPRFRGRSSLVESLSVIDDHTLIVHCPNTSPEVGTRALTVPILPAHIWRERAVKTTAGWLDDTEPVSEAVLWTNAEPVGSGVVQFEGRAKDESLVLTRADDHFLHQTATPAVPDPIAGGIAFDRLSLRVAPSSHAAVQLLSADEADATAMSIAPNSVPRVGQDDQLQLYVENGRSFHYLGFNTQRQPLDDPLVRRAITRLLDKHYIVESIFDGFALPATSPLTGTDWEPSDLIWNGSDPEVPFVGADGSVDGERARELFRDAGLEYSDDGRLLDR